MENVQQLYTNCLAQGAYFISSNGEAAVIDPLRETWPYLQKAKDLEVEIKYIFETHFHADFVSGHLDLAKKTGATIVYGPGAATSFEKHTAKDGETFQIGALTMKALHTPGHTPESTTYLLFDENGKEHAIFTGDTLFIGDVGRPDLAQKATGLTQEDLASWLFDSLREKIMPLPDDVIVYPAHGAGSACGKNMSSETWDTLGNQKATNYALRQDMTKAEFVNEVTAGLMAPPQYFAKNAAMNKKGYDSIDNVMAQGNRPLSVEAFEKVLQDDSVVVLDVRDKKDFVQGYIPGAYFVGLDGSFAPWVGALLTDIQQKIALIVPEGREEEAVKRLARVGYDHAIGYLAGGVEAWKSSGRPLQKIHTISTEEFIKSHYSKEVNILDVRKPGEYETTHIVDAKNQPLDYFPKGEYKTLDKTKTYYVHCRSGYRSTVASSFLIEQGLEVVNVVGPFDEIKNDERIPVEGSCPSLISA